MAKVFLILTVVLVTFTLTITAKAPSDDTKKEMSKAMPAASNMDDIDLMGAMRECNETFRTEVSYLMALNESGSFPDESDRTPKCYVRCVLERTSVASEDGQFDGARAAVVFAGTRVGQPMEDIEEMASACSDRKETCKCERAYQFMKCLMEMEIKKYEKTK